jgi:predicted dinucleotide-binding enzyme
LLLRIGSSNITGFYCGDDSEAKQTAAALLADAGFDPLDAGGLQNARHLESLGQFLIALAFGQSLGVETGWAFLQHKK